MKTTFQRDIKTSVIKILSQIICQANDKMLWRNWKKIVKNRTIPEKPLSATSEKKELDVAKSFVEDYSSMKQLSNIQSLFMQRILKQISSIIKIHLVQEIKMISINKTNFVISWCKELMKNLFNFLFNIVFSYKATYIVNGNINRHNCRSWSDKNPH